MFQNIVSLNRASLVVLKLMLLKQPEGQTFGQRTSEFRKDLQYEGHNDMTCFDEGSFTAIIYIVG